MTFEEIYKLFENPLINITFFGGIIFSLAGVIMLYFPPKRINALYGYRTKKSMINQERWDFAQKYSAKEMIKLGGLLSCCSVFGFISKFEEFINMIIGLSLLILTAIILMFRVEKAINKRFGKIF